MNSIFAMHEPEHNHLHRVMGQMMTKGPPRLWAFWRTYKGRRGWYVLEGSHRTAAASRLALTPIIVPVVPTQTIQHDINRLKEQRLMRVADVLEYFDAIYKRRQWGIWLEYKFPNLRGPRGGS